MNADEHVGEHTGSREREGKKEEENAGWMIQFLARSIAFFFYSFYYTTFFFYFSAEKKRKK